MTIHRRLLYVISIASFLIAGSVLVIYSQGYRYNPALHRFVKVGALYVKSYPTGSHILIDGADTNVKTPHRVFDVTPGKHTVTVQRTNYQPWSKELEVHSGETTFARDPILFFEKPATTLLGVGGSKIIRSHDKILYSYIDNEGFVQIVNTNTGRQFSIQRKLSPELLFTISPDNTNIVYLKNDRLTVLNINTEQSQSIALKYVPVSKVQWDTQNNSLLWILAKGTVYAYDLITEKAQPFTEKCGDFIVRDDVMVVTRKSTGNHVLLETISTTSHETQGSWDVPTSDPIRVVEYSDAYITVLGSSTVWLLPLADSLPVQSWNANQVIWDREKLITTNGFDINYFNSDTGTRQLLDRSSEKTEKIGWHSSGSYYFQYKSGALYLTEIDGRDKRNFVILAHESDLTDVLFDKKGENMYVLTSTKNTAVKIQ